MTDPQGNPTVPPGADELARERDRLETSPAMPPEAERVDDADDAAPAAPVKHERAGRMTH